MEGSGAFPTHLILFLEFLMLFPKLTAPECKLFSLRVTCIFPEGPVGTPAGQRSLWRWRDAAYPRRWLVSRFWEYSRTLGFDATGNKVTGGNRLPFKTFTHSRATTSKKPQHWVFVRRTPNIDSKGRTRPCVHSSIIPNNQALETAQVPAPQQRSGCKSVGTCMQWNTTQP